MIINEDSIKEYVMNNIRLFTIKDIHTVRDARTIQIICTNGDCFSIDKNTLKLYKGFPIDNKNEIKDKLLLKYLLERIQNYSNRLKEESIRIENLTNELLEKY